MFAICFFQIQLAFVYKKVASVGMERGENALILGSLPPPFFERFCSRHVEEKGDDCVLGFFCSSCGRVRVGQLQDGRCIHGAAEQRKTGRKAERFILCGGWGEGDRNWTFGRGFDVAPSSWCWGNSRLSKWQGVQASLSAKRD